MHNIDVARVPVDLNNCDREPIHIPGAILPHGAMLVLDAETLEVQQAAGDTQTLLGVAIEALLGTSVTSLFSPEQLARLRHLARENGLARPRHLLDPIMRVIADCPTDASAHRSGASLVIEFEAADTSDPYSGEPLVAVQEMVAGFSNAAGIAELCQLAAAEVHRVAGYDRVMVYRFMADASGWVIAESKVPELSAFIDLHYPATDIPQQARALYLKNWLRLITRVDYTAAPLIPVLNPRTGAPLDMSHALLRDVSPIHRQYLRNMGIDASMSISIIVEGRLWGLIACHHNSPRLLPRHLRAVCELFGAMFSLQLEALERSTVFSARLANRAVLQQLALKLSSGDNYALGLTQQSPDLLDYINGGVDPDGLRSGGVALCVDGVITMLGTTPDLDQIMVLTDWLSGTMSEFDGMLSTDRLGEIFAPAKAYAGIGSGLLAISVSRAPADFILWFRPELVETTLWAGDPVKVADGEILTPRHSFGAWKQIVRGHAQPWTTAETDAAFDLRVLLLQVVLSRVKGAALARERAHERDKLLMAELDHRVKNTLAKIQTLVHHASRSADSLSGFVTGLDGRLQSMAKAHSLLTQSRWERASIEGLLREELKPYTEEGVGVRLSGPQVMLTPNAALALSLVVHELATNAAKFGAFSVAGGQIEVGWDLDNGGISLVWRERGGPQVATPTRRGFGTVLVERALALETGGEAVVTFDAAGVICAIKLPAAAIIADSQPLITAESASDLPIIETPIRPRILLAEDSVFIIMTLEAMCEDMGWDVIGPATRVEEGVRLATTERCDAALLDVKLDNAFSWPIAAALQARGVPFVFGTGYDLASVLPPEFAGVAMFSKPYSIADVERQLRQLLAV